MKKSAICIAFLMMACITGLNYSSIAEAQDAIPEFDGGYVKTTAGKYVEMKGVNAYRTQISREGLSVFDLAKLPKHYYVIDKMGIVDIPSADFKGILLKGKHKFESFSLHPLDGRKLKSSEGFFENRGPAVEGKPFYEPGKKIETRKKAVGPDGYYFEPKNALEKGEYVGWIGETFLLFAVR